MDVTEFAFRIILLFLPGVLVYTVEKELTHLEKRDSHDFIVYSLLYGFLSYFLYFLLLKAINFFIDPDIPIHLFEAIATSGTRPDFTEIFYVTFLALLLSVFVTKARTNKWIHRIARKGNLTNKTGEVDIFPLFLWSKNLKEKWIVVRDFENDKAYYGWLAAHSVGEEKNELLLFNVVIMENKSGERIGETPAVYIPINREKMVVEFTSVDYNQWG